MKELNLDRSTYFRYKREYGQSKKDKSKEKRNNTIENDLEKWDKIKEFKDNNSGIFDSKDRYGGPKNAKQMQSKRKLGDREACLMYDCCKEGILKQDSKGNSNLWKKAAYNGVLTYLERWSNRKQ